MCISCLTKDTVRMVSPQRNSGKEASIRGLANELVVLGILLPEFPEAMLAAHQNSSHDMIIPVSHEDFVRVQIKTSQKSISLGGGSRGGIDRTYLAGINNPKTYRYTTENTDLIIGIKQLDGLGRYDLYFVPSKVVELIDQQSISVNKVGFTKNDINIIKICKDPSYIQEYMNYLN